MAATAFMLETVSHRTREIRRVMKLSEAVHIPELIVSFSACFYIEIGTLDVVDSCESALNAISRFHFPLPLPGIEIDTANPKAFDVLKTKPMFTKLSVNGPHQTYIHQLSKFIAKSNHIERLWIFNQALGDSAASILMEGLLSNRSVKHLNLSNNNLSNRSAHQLAKWLRDSPIVLLDISYNSIDNSGIEELMKVVGNHKTLRILRIGDNDIGIEGQRAICNCLKLNNVLQELEMNGLMIISDGWQLLSKALVENISLRYISLEGTWLTNQDLKVLSVGLASHPNLREINLAENQLTNKAAFELKKVLMTNGVLEDIDLGYNRMTDRIASFFTNKQQWALNPNVNIAFSFRSTFWNSEGVAF